MSKLIGRGIADCQTSCRTFVIMARGHKIVRTREDPRPMGGAIFLIPTSIGLAWDQMNKEGFASSEAFLATVQQKSPRLAEALAVVCFCNPTTGN